MTAIEHINYRHAFNSGFDDVSRSAQGTGARQIQGYVDDALRYGDVSQGGASIRYDLGRVIGYDQAANPVTGSRSGSTTATSGPTRWRRDARDLGFFLNEFNDYVAGVLRRELAARGHAELTINIFNVVLDPEAGIASAGRTRS